MLLLCLLLITPTRASGFTIPPLTEEQAELLATTHPNREFHEPAFFALLENTRVWDDPPGDAPVRLTFMEETVRDAEAAYRGELYRLEGRLEQVEWLSEPYDGVIAWFLRDEQGVARLVFVDKRPGFVDVTPGERAVVYARFYKFIDKMAADGISRSYATFVGALPARMSPMPQSMERPPAGVIVLVVATVGVAFLLVRRAAQRTRHRTQRAVQRSVPGELDDAEDFLPSEPDAALAELARRAKDSR